MSCLKVVGPLGNFIMWLKYIFAKPVSLRAIICRYRGHPGVVWYNPNGSEPDMHCRNCGDDLG